MKQFLAFLCILFAATWAGAAPNSYTLSQYPVLQQNDFQFDLGLGGQFTSLGQYVYSNTTGDLGEPPYNVTPGSDISATLIKALSIQRDIVLPLGRSTYILENVPISSGSLDCRGATLQIGPTAGDVSYGIEGTGSNFRLKNCNFQDPNNYGNISTSLAAISSPGDTTISVASPAGFHVGNVLTETLNSGIQYATVITSVVGTTIGLQDPVITSATAITITGSPSNCQVGDWFIAQGGSGPPATFQATQVTPTFQASLWAPGYYVTAPSGTLTAAPGEINHCSTNYLNGVEQVTGLTFTLTTSGAAGGNSINTGYPELWLHNANTPLVDFIHFTNGGYDMTEDGTTAAGTVSNIYMGASQVDFYGSAGPVEMRHTNWQLYGPGGSGHQAMAILIDEAAGTQTGDTWSGIAVEGAQIGYNLVRSGGMKIIGSFSDDALYYGFVNNAGSTDQFSVDRVTHTGGTTNNNAGVAFTFFNGASAQMSAIHTANNASDLSIQDTANVGIDQGSWGPGRAIDLDSPCGQTIAIGANWCGPPGSLGFSAQLLSNGAALNFPPGGRLSLSSSTPVPIGNISGATTIYYQYYSGQRYVPYKFNWNGQAGVMFLQIPGGGASMGLDATVPNIVSGNVYDIWAVYNPVNQSGTSVLMAMCAGPAWTTATAPGARSVGQHTSFGFSTNNGTLTHCYGGASGTTDYGPISQDNATLLGSFYATANGQTSMIQSCTGAGGCAPIMGLSNAYNQVQLCVTTQDTTTSYTYTSSATPGWRNADNSGSNKAQWLDTLDQAPVAISYQQSGKYSAVGPLSGVLIDGASAPLLECGTDATVNTSLGCGTLGLPPQGLGLNTAQAADGTDGIGAAIFNVIHTTGSYGNALTVCLPN